MQTTLTFEQAAGIVEIGLSLDLFDREDVVAWADGWIAKLPTPPLWLIQLATSSSLWRGDVEALLRERAPCVYPKLALQVLLGLVNHRDVEVPFAIHALTSVAYGLLWEISDDQWVTNVRQRVYQLSYEYERVTPRPFPNASEDGLRKEVNDFYSTYAVQPAGDELSPLRIRITKDWNTL